MLFEVCYVKIWALLSFTDQAVGNDFFKIYGIFNLAVSNLQWMQLAGWSKQERGLSTNIFVIIKEQVGQGKAYYP